jgi:hypothetical protein
MSKTQRDPQRSLRELEVIVEGFEAPLRFQVSQSDFGKFMREMQRDVAMASNNLVLGTCAADQREALREELQDDWGLAMQITAEMQGDLIGARQVALKKP